MKSFTTLVMALFLVVGLSACKKESAKKTHSHDQNHSHGHGEGNHHHDHSGHDHAGHDHSGHSHGSAKANPPVYFETPEDGATIKPDHKFVFGLRKEGWSIRPAGPIVPQTGHHHVLINKDHMKKGIAIPNNPTHLHYGKGQTEAVLNLKPGKYKLTLQFADGAHQSYGPDMSQTISVTVKE